MNVLDLFSGIGGFSIGLERAGMRTVAFCEIDPYCRAVLRKHWPGVPIHEDVRKLAGADVGPVDVICGGFPCQPFSRAGARMGDEDNRHLWPEYRRLIEELRPTWVIGENVIGLWELGLDAVLDDLEALGYAYRPFDIPACSVGAKHERRRFWIVAHSHDDRATDNRIRGVRGNQEQYRAAPEPERNAKQYGDVGDGRSDASDSERDCIQRRAPDAKEGSQFRREQQLPGFLFPSIGDALSVARVWRADHGVSSRMDIHRNKAIGNAVVPQIPEIIGRAILKCATP